jgi:aerobic carbon-monoxide dehydrogenase large subunit
MASILGNRVPRVEDPRMLTVGGTYVEDVRVPDDIAGHGRVAWVHFVRSNDAHGRIRSIDVDEAKSMPGVLGIFTGADIDLPPFPHGQPFLPAGCERQLLAHDVVRFVGEPIVAVVATDRQLAVDAAANVIVDIDPLSAVIELDDALADKTLVHEAIGTNVYGRFASKKAADFSQCEVVLSLQVMNERINGAPMEPRSGLAYWEPSPEGDRLVHYSSCQGAHPTRDMLARLYNLPVSQVRAVVPDVGGGFGVKSRTIGEELTLGWLSRATGVPVRFTETRTESMMAMPQGRGQRMDVKIGGTRDGRVTAYQLDVVQDAGAYALMGAYLPEMTHRMVPGVYDIENCGFTGVSVATNKISVTAYRGAGRPEAALAIERAMDFFAAHIGMDPAEVRRRNFIPKFLEAYTTGIGTVYDVGDYREALDRALGAADYDTLRADQSARRARGDRVQVGIGLCAYVEITSAANPSESGTIELQSDGRMRLVTGSTPYGQGHVTTWKMLAADRLGVSMDDVDVIHGDTDQVATGGLTVGSRSVQLAGSAVVVAAAKLIDAARERAAQLLEAAIEDVVLDDGVFHVAGSPAPSVNWVDVATAVQADGDTALKGISDFVAPQPTFPFGAHVAVVHVDTDTGRWPDSWWHRPGCRTGVNGVDAVRRVRQSRHVELCRLPGDLRGRIAQLRVGPHGNAHMGQPARRKGCR